MHPVVLVKCRRPADRPAARTDRHQPCRPLSLKCPAIVKLGWSEAHRRRAFLQFASHRDLSSLQTLEQALGVPMKRFEQPMCGFLSRGSTSALPPCTWTTKMWPGDPALQASRPSWPGEPRPSKLSCPFSTAFPVPPNRVAACRFLDVRQGRRCNPDREPASGQLTPPIVWALMLQRR